MDTWITQMIRATSRRRVVAWVLVTLCVAGGLATQRRYIQNFLKGPYVLRAADLAKITDADAAPRYFVRVSGTKAIDTGLREVTIEKRNGVETGRSDSGTLYALVVDPASHKALLCKSTAGERTTYEGELKPLTTDLQGKLMSTPDEGDVRDLFYPYYLDEVSFRTPGYVGIGALVVLLIALAVSARPAWRTMHEPKSHQLAKRVETWGDPYSIAPVAESEARSPALRGGGGWLIGEQYLIRSSFFTFDLLRMGDLLWAYKKVTQHRTNFIPTGKTYEALLVCVGGTASVPGNEAAVERILGFAAQQTPWAVLGYSKEAEQLLQKDPGAFAAAVADRKREFEQSKQTAPVG